MKNSERKCSYCNNIGHIITSCTTRKLQLSKAESVNAEARKQTVDLMDKLGLYVGALIELKYRDFNSLTIMDPETDSEMSLFYVKEIRWHAINKTMIDTVLGKRLKEYLQEHRAIRSNYSNIILVNPSYPNGFGMTVTYDKLKKAHEQTEPFNTDNNLIGDFIVHDSGIKEKSLETIPKDFFQGKFYSATKKIIK